MLFSLLFLLVPSRSQVVFRSSWKITEILDWTQLLKVINRWVFHCLTGSFYGMDREQYYPDLKISKSRSTKICGATTLFSNKTEIVKWDKKYENCYWITRDCHFFFKLFMTSLHFDSDVFQLIRKQRCRNSHETVIWSFVTCRVTEEITVSW